MIKIEQLEWFK